MLSSSLGNNFLTECLVNLVEDGMCSKESAPSVSSISRVLRGGGHTLDGDMDGRPSHSIDGILGTSEMMTE